MSETASATDAVLAAGESQAIPHDVYCPDCGYDLRGLTSARCPECGFDLERIRTRTPQIPWAQRARRGRFKAYWQTVIWVARRKRHWCMEAVRPVDYSAARWFILMVALQAAICVALGTLLVMFALSQDIAGIGWVAWLLAPLAPLSVFVGLSAIAGVASYFFHPRDVPVELQNRALALSYYAWAPFAELPATLLLIPIGIVLVSDAPVFGWRSGIGVALFLAAAGHVVSMFVRAYANLDTLSDRVLRRVGWRRLWRIVWMLMAQFLAVLLLALLPASVIYVFIIIDSLRE